MSEQAGKMNAARRILIVGDPALSRGLMKMVLTRLGYVVTCASGAAEAHAALSHTRFALVMVALQLPDLPGLTFARRFRETDPAGTPVLLFGDAWDQEVVQQDCRAAGLDGYLPKPISIGRLVATVRELTSQALDQQHGGSAMPAPIELAHFTSFTDGDEQLERELGSIYLATASTYLDEMRSALSKGEPWSRTVHSLKGASANIGANELAAIAKAVEHDTPSATALAQLEAALDEVRRFFAHRGLPEAMSAQQVSLR